MTIYDISEKAGVSIATVSRVLNGSNNVSEKTKKKVLDVINQYEYTPNAFARGLGLNTMKTIGIMCADSSDLYLAKAIYYIEQKLRANGYDSILCCTGYDLATKASSMNLLITKKVDGIILVGSNFIYEKEEDNKYITDASAQVPVMLLNAAMDAPNVYSVVSDDFTSMYDATMEMIRSGVKIFCISIILLPTVVRKSWQATVPPWKKKDFSPTEASCSSIRDPTRIFPPWPIS